MGVDCSLCGTIWSSLRKAGRKFFWIAALALIDPFGWASATESLSQDLALIVMAPFYRLFDAPANASAPITVVLIDEETLARLGTGYPLDDDTLNGLLTKIACNEPKTMFLDMLLGGPRPGGAEVNAKLVELMAAGKAASVQGDRPTIAVPSDKCASPMPPFYVADVPPPEGTSLDAAPAKSAPGGIEVVASAIRVASRRLPVQWSKEHYLYPTSLAQSATIDADGWATLPTVGLPTPALQLYTDIQRASSPATPVDISDIPDEMVIGWGWKHRQLPDWFTSLQSPQQQPLPTTVSDWMCGFARTDNSPYPEDWKLRLLYATGISISQFVLTLVSPLRSWCGEPAGSPPQKYIYTLVVPAWQILSRANALPPGAVEGAIKDRAVLIGQNVVGAADAVNSPVHGVVPGVVVHAQALDNLLNWHGRVWRPMPTVESWPSWISLGWVLGLTFLYILNFLEAFLPARFGLSVDKTAILLGALTVTLALCQAILFCLAPINWIGYLLSVFWEPVEERLTKKEETN